MSYRRLLVALLSMVAAQPAFAQGYLEWRFGMSPDEVAAVEAYSPYTPIGDGDLETANGRFEGRPINVSFHFTDTGMEKVQIWLCEEATEDEALRAWAAAEAHIRGRFGATEARGLGLDTVASQEQLLAAARRWLGAAPSQEMLKLQLGPKTMPDEAIVFSSLLRHPQHGYFVFLYYRRPANLGDTPDS